MQLQPTQRASGIFGSDEDVKLGTPQNGSFLDGGDTDRVDLPPDVVARAEPAAVGLLNGDDPGRSVRKWFGAGDVGNAAGDVVGGLVTSMASAADDPSLRAAVDTSVSPRPPGSETDRTDRA
jgi:hypothetical protein